MLPHGTLCSLRRLALATLMALGLVAPASAQGVGSFDPQTHLSGYHEAFLGDFGDLYDFKPFQDLIGRALDAREMDALRKAWEAEHRRAAERIAKIEADPREAYLYALD